MTKKRIQVVEDEIILALDLKKKLQNLGYTVPAVVSSGEKAVQKAEETNPDLVLMDIRLKGKMDGIEAAQIIHESMDVPVVYLTAYADKETLKRAKITEPFGYLLKPFVSEELHAAIETSLYKHKMDKRLKESEEKYRKLFEESRDAIYMTSQKRKLLDVNQFAMDLFGYKREEMLNMDEKVLYVHSDDLARVHHEIELNGSVKEVEVELCKKDGTRIWCLITATIRRTSDGNILGHQGIIRDITIRKQAEEEIKEKSIELEKNFRKSEKQRIATLSVLSDLNKTTKELQFEIKERKKAEGQVKKDLKEKEILLRELYHRTKNNMQVICSMLRLHSYKTKNQEAIAIFSDLESKIHTMALVHQKLYESKDLSRINLKYYFKDLVTLLIQSNRMFFSKITIQMDMEDINVLIDTAIPCGLVFNELLSNIVKHAFPDNKKGKIKIRLTLSTNNKIIIEVSDNGVGFPEDFDINNKSNFGLGILTGLVEHQLQGKIKFTSKNGLRCRIMLREEGYEERV